MPNGQQVIIPLYPYTQAKSRTEIYIPRRTLITEGSYNFDGEGYFPTIPHEAAHASPEVKRHPKFE
jgi:hypothetical protein